MSRRRPSSPHPRGVPLPFKNFEDATYDAAAAIAQADAILICSGAGMGVDCGFGTFQGRNAGVWGPLHALKLDYQQISDPDWFESDLGLAWNYWGSSSQLYSSTLSHDGYKLSANWGRNLKHGMFCVTSNIDGHWQRFTDANQIYEVHGCVSQLQRVDGTGNVWPASSDDIRKLEIPTWDLGPGEDVEVRVAAKGEWGPWTAALVGDDGFKIVSVEDGNRIEAHGVRRLGGEDLLRINSIANLPSCLESGSQARPNVLMFGDPNFNASRVDAQDQTFANWRSSLPADIRLVVLEIGAGRTIPTIRDLAEMSVNMFERAVLIRINLDDAHVGEHFQGKSVAVSGVGALEAITAIDTKLQTLFQKAS